MCVRKPPHPPLVLTLATHLARRWCRWGGQGHQASAECLRRGRGRCIKGGINAACVCVCCSGSGNSSALKRFKLSTVRVASFHASTQQPDASATSDVGSSSSFIHPRRQHLKDVQQLRKGHFIDTTRFLGGTHQLKAQAKNPFPQYFAVNPVNVTVFLHQMSKLPQYSDEISSQSGFCAPFRHSVLQQLCFKKIYI